MNILGWTHSNESHDTSAAIVCDGQLVAAAEEERFTRRKHEDAFPLRAIDFCLRKAGLEMVEIDLIAVPDKPYRSGKDSYLARVSLDELKRAEKRVRIRRWAHKLALDAYLRIGPPFNWQMNHTVASGLALLRTHYSELPEIRYYDHHLAHATAAYFTSGLDRSTIVTMDYNGGPYSTVTWLAEGTRLTRLRAEVRSNSVGKFYWDCTHYLGFGQNQEGKTMGLAAYGDRGSLSAPVSLILDTKNFDWYKYCQLPSEHILGFGPRSEQAILDSPYPDFAAAVQAALESATLKVVRSAIADANCSDLCLGGGVMLNCSSNGALLNSDPASSIWIFPAAGDAGLSVGVALICAAEAGELTRNQLPHAYWGPEFGQSECEAALRNVSGISFRRSNRIVKEAAQYLAAGEVVGWFQGRMELGPRALGNRSILSHPGSVEMRDRVNKIKGREIWRPLAPVVLAECASEFFTQSIPSPFMLFATQIRPEKRSLVPAIVHVDGSARPQTVTRAQNPLLYELILAFSEETGVPMLLNTSFNAQGEPLVCAPQDAIKTFLATKLDVLVLGDFVVRRNAHA